MGEHERGDAADVVDRRRSPAVEPGERGGGAAQREVGAQALGADGQGQPARRLEDVIAHGRGPGGGERSSPAPRRPPRTRDRRRDRRWARRRRTASVRSATSVGRGDVDAQPEAVEQLRAQLALLGVHRADEHEPGRVAVGDAVALDEVLAGDGDVEQDVDEVVGEQVDLVDVEHAAVGGGEQAGPERQLAAGQRSGDVERAEQAVLGRAERQLGEAARAGRRGPGPASSWPSPCGRAAGRRRSAGRPPPGEGQLGVVLADDGAERQADRGRSLDSLGRTPPSPRLRARRAVSVRRAPSVAAHMLAVGGLQEALGDRAQRPRVGLLRRTCASPRRRRTPR